MPFLILSRKSIFVAFAAFSVSLLISTLLLDSISEDKERNDLAAYETHFECLDGGFNSLLSCQVYIGSPPDILYQSFANIFNFFFGGVSFELFVFIFSFLVYFGLLFFSAMMSRYSSVAFIFLLSDFRFYELGANVLRNGLAVVLVLAVIYYNKGLVFRLSPLVAHLSSFPYLLAFRLKIKPVLHLTIFSLLYIFSQVVVGAVVTFSDYFPDSLSGKVLAYNNHLDFNIFNLPAHYLLLFILGAFICKSKSNNAYGSIPYNVFYMFMCAAVVFGSMGIGYRFLNFVPPFAAMVLSEILHHSKNKFGPYPFFITYLFVILFCVLLYFKNIDFIARMF